ncbi:MAG: DUF1540 domain-containing protein [Clostridia bacterium]|nr:DUF1540 domain-containing protein [Clostridia bacterium]
MDTPNRSIECTVDQCRYHCSDCDYCSLNTVRIGTHEMNPTEKQCVDCRSFEVKY